MNLERNLVTAAILGHAIGDALGVPVEFESRSVLRQDPVLGMRGHGTYDVPAGTWSDDTSLTLALLDSLAHLFDIPSPLQALQKTPSPEKSLDRAE